MFSVTENADSRGLPGLLVGLAVLGIALLVANVPGSPLRSSDLSFFVVFVLPLLISVVTYLHFVAHRVWWEVGVLALWSTVSLALTMFVAFLATMGTPSSYPGALMELTGNIAMFLGASLGLGVPYALAGKFRRNNPKRAAICAFLAGVTVFVVVTLVTIIL